MGKYARKCILNWIEQPNLIFTYSKLVEPLIWIMIVMNANNFKTKYYLLGLRNERFSTAVLTQIIIKLIDAIIVQKTSCWILVHRPVFPSVPFRSNTDFNIMYCIIHGKFAEMLMTYWDQVKCKDFLSEKKGQDFFLRSAYFP